MSNHNFKLIDEIFSRILTIERDDVIISEESIKTGNLSNIIQEDSINFEYFCKRIKEEKERLDIPRILFLANVFDISFHISIHTTHISKTKEEYKNNIKTFIWQLLDDKSENLISLGLLIFQYSSRFFLDDNHRFIERIAKLWDHSNLVIRSRAIKTLEYKPSTNYSYFIKYIEKLKKMILSDETSVKTYSMNLFGNLFFYASKSGKSIEISREEINEFINNAVKIDDDSDKIKYYEGLENLLYKYPYSEYDWIQFLINQYLSSNLTGLKNQILRILVYFPNKKNLSNSEVELYHNFFEDLLENLLEEDQKIEEPKVLYKPNVFMDIMHNFEQLCFALPEVVERLYQLYKDIVAKYFPDLEGKGLTSKGLIRQWTHEVLGLLIQLNKKKLDSLRIIELSENMAAIAYSKLEALELTINSLKHKIRMAIKDKEFSKVKEIFRELQELFKKFLESQSIHHQCYPIWTLMEDLIYLLTCDQDNYQRERDRLVKNLKENNEKIPGCYYNLFEKYIEFKPKIDQLKKSDSFKECLTIFKDISEILKEILESTINIDTPLLKNIFEQINKSNEYNLLDTAGRTNIEIIQRSRRERGFLDVKDEDHDLFCKVAEILNDIDINTFYPENLPHEDEISKKFAEILRQHHIPNIETKTQLSGGSHIDITSGEIIAIEVKKLTSSERKDDLIGQLYEDLRIGNFQFGIGYGIDIAKTHLLIRHNYHIIDFPNNRLLLVIKPKKLK